ncbi:hypothetical protein QYM36_007899 [Artemia franciscana]|nr:hypothetical protein QYM36_007899 [Artemia franciscana]
MPCQSEVVDFYSGRSIFITGATGFLGKILLEKLLRTCPDIKFICLLVRNKAGQDAKMRVQDLLNSRVFESLRLSQPELFCKVVPVSGDITLPGLGISESDMTMMSQNVSVAFHCAATVRFDEPLKSAVDLNMKGVKRMLDVCKKLKHLEVLIHVSTAYVNCLRPELNETIYPAVCDPSKLMNTLDWLDEGTVTALTKSLLNGLPNTYTYTKGLGEHVIRDESLPFPVAIIRPTIVTSSWKEPMPGWVDSINGPTGFVAGCAAGIFRTLYCHTHMITDLIPAEYPTNLMISAAWHTVEHRMPSLCVYTIGSSGLNPVYWSDLEKYIYPYMMKNPISMTLWPPGGSFKSSYVHHKIDMVLYHNLPAYTLDFLVRCCGKKPFFVKLHKKAAKAMDSLQFYTIREWRSRCDNSMSLVERLNNYDKQLFNFDPRTIDWKDYLCAYYLGIRRFILKDDLNTLPAARKHFRR